MEANILAMEMYSTAGCSCSTQPAAQPTWSRAVGMEREQSLRGHNPLIKPLLSFNYILLNDFLSTKEKKNLNLPNPSYK